MKSIKLTTVVIFIFSVFFVACKKLGETKNESSSEVVQQVEIPTAVLENTPFSSVVKASPNTLEIKSLLESMQQRGVNIDELDKKNIWVYRTKSKNFNFYSFATKNCKALKNVENISFISIIEYTKTGLKEISRNSIRNVFSNGRIYQHEYYKYNLTGDLIGGAFLINGRIADDNFLGKFGASLHNCYMSYSTCVNTVVEEYTSDNLGATIAEWIPLRTMANISCTILKQEGYIYGGKGFDFANCGTLYL